MRIVAVPCLKDNYAYLVIEGTYAVIVDPSEHTPVRSAIAREGVTLKGIWLTHHHWDHVGGVEKLVEEDPSLEVYAHETDAEKIKGVTHRVKDGDTIHCGPLTAKIVHNPGHTLGAISYWIDDAVFTGDTLFGAGCGRVFEGTMEMMHASLQKLGALPPATRVYFGHEYTASNLRYGIHAEPDNAAMKQRAESLTPPSTPSTIQLERDTNPFLRVTDAAGFAARRTEKDTFK
ncbi:MAG TPA: hydroxyacylglutathione hydrolase [Kofleriaceae bacterium]|nr:hydroxyacylglutathione hydrolase [Kofleriaceae bacterium]